MAPQEQVLARVGQVVRPRFSAEQEPRRARRQERAARALQIPAAVERALAHLPLSSMAAGGGGSGEYVELIISNPSATYTYTVGAGGAAGIGTGAGATTGGAGATGFITVEEAYNF